MKISGMQQLIFISGMSSCLQLCAMQPATEPVLTYTEPVATYDVGFNEKLEITPSLVQPQGHKFLVIAAAQHQAGKKISRPRSLIDLSLAESSTTPKIALANKADKNVGNVGMEEMNDKNDKDETLSASSEHFSVEVEVGQEGSCFHCRSHVKSKKIAGYIAATVGGLALSTVFPPAAVIAFIH